MMFLTAPVFLFQWICGLRTNLGNLINRPGNYCSVSFMRAPVAAIMILAVVLAAGCTGQTPESGSQPSAQESGRGTPKLSDGGYDDIFKFDALTENSASRWGKTGHNVNEPTFAIKDSNIAYAGSSSLEISASSYSPFIISFPLPGSKAHWDLRGKSISFVYKCDSQPDGWIQMNFNKCEACTAEGSTGDSSANSIQYGFRDSDSWLSAQMTLQDRDPWTGIRGGFTDDDWSDVNQIEFWIGCEGPPANKCTINCKIDGLVIS